MYIAIDRLRSLRVKDLMSKSVVRVDAEATLAEVAQTFAGHGVSSAPVTDDQGRCVGIVSAADFVRLVERERTDEPVSRHMTSGVQSVPPETKLLAAARIMCAEHIHHLPVIDQDEQVVGVLSTLDLVASMVNAVDEMEARGGS